MSFNVPDYFGTSTTVRHVHGAYRLPEGLNEGDEVTLALFSRDIGMWSATGDGIGWHVNADRKALRPCDGVGDCCFGTFNNNEGCTQIWKTGARYAGGYSWKE